VASPLVDSVDVLEAEVVALVVLVVVDDVAAR